MKVSAHAWCVIVVLMLANTVSFVDRLLLALRVTLTSVREPAHAQIAHPASVVEVLAHNRGNARRHDRGADAG